MKKAVVRITEGGHELISLLDEKVDKVVKADDKVERYLEEILESTFDLSSE
jgi:hypothetical protein